MVKVLISLEWSGISFTSLGIHEICKKKGLKRFLYIEKTNYNFKPNYSEYTLLKTEKDMIEFDNSKQPHKYIEMLTENMGDTFTVFEKSEEYKKLNDIYDLDFTYTYSSSLDIRIDKDILEVIEELEKQNKKAIFGKYKIVEIPDNVEWYIYQPDYGQESIHEKHRVWS